MGDLTDEELDAIDQRQSQNRKYLGDVETTIDRAVAEIRRHRTAASASEERVREVVEREAAAVLGPNGLAFEQRWDVLSSAIATRAAKQLAGAVRPALTVDERNALLDIRSLVRIEEGRSDRRLWEREAALLDRLLASTETT